MSHIVICPHGKAEVHCAICDTQARIENAYLSGQHDERERCAKIADEVLASKEELVTTSYYPDARAACVEIAAKIRSGE